MITQENRNQTQEVKEEQISRRETMATQTMVGPNINPATVGNRHLVSTPTAQETSRKGADLLNRLSQVCWRVSFEVAPLFQGFFSPFTAQIRRCRSLSSRDQAEFEALMKKR